MHRYYSNHIHSVCKIVFLCSQSSLMARDLKIVTHSLRILDTFDESCFGINEHLKSFFEVSGHDIIDEEGYFLVKEIVTGCVRYKALIKALLELFYAGDGKTCLRADYNLFSVVSLLAIFYLEDIGLNRFKNIVSSRNTSKMFKILAFLYKKDNLDGRIREEWNRVYDAAFVSESIISPMMRHIDEMSEFITYLQDKLANKVNTKAISKPATEPIPFKLTKPSPRVISYEVEEVPTLEPHKPVPQTTYQQPVVEQSLAKAFQINRQMAEDILLEADRTQFLCANPDKSEKTLRKMERIKAEQEAKFKHIPVKPAPLPMSLGENCPVKTNATTIYRENARIQKEERLLKEKFARIQAGDGDISDYFEWQREVKEKAAAEEVAERERKHLAGQLSHEEAFLAKQQCIQGKKDIVQKLRTRSQELMDQYFTQKQHEKQEMRRLVEATSAGQHNVKEARAKLTAMKQKIVQQVAKEKQDLLAKALEQEEAEMRKKSELIRQIHAMETVPIIKANFLDLTETSGIGLFSEMSIVELHERLSLMKITAEEEMKERRQIIKSSKEAKEQHLNETAKNISQYKEERKRHSAAEREDNKRIFNTHHAQIQAQTLDVLQEKLEDKKRERLRHQKLSMQVFPPASITNRRTSIKPLQPQSTSSLRNNNRTLHKSRTAVLTSGNTGKRVLAVSPPPNPMATLIRACK